MDGIDAALTEIEGQPPDLEIRLLRYQKFNYPPGLKERIRKASRPASSRVDQICHLNYYVGELFAGAANHLVAGAGIKPREVKLIGSHGQTIHHLPEPGREPHPDGDLEIRSSFQIGEAAVITERTGITTISDFRARDLAAGGLGAPLLPYLHFLLFGSNGRRRDFFHRSGRLFLHQSRRLNLGRFNPRFGGFFNLGFRGRPVGSFGEHAQDRGPQRFGPHAGDNLDPVVRIPLLPVLLDKLMGLAHCGPPFPTTSWVPELFHPPKVAQL